MEDNGPPHMSWDSVAPIIEESNIIDSNEEVINVRNINDEDEDNSEVNDLDIDSSRFGNKEKDILAKNKISMLLSREACKGIMSNSEYCYHLRNLNSGQRKIITYNQMWCKSYLRSL